MSAQKKLKPYFFKSFWRASFAQLGRTSDSDISSSRILFAASSTAPLFFIAGKAKLNYAVDKKVYVVLEEDGTEVDEEEYFQTLPANTLLMLLYVGDRWSPFGPPFT